MAEAEIIDQVYEETVRQLCTVLFQELIQVDANSRHEGAERRFRNGLKSAAIARDRAKVLIGAE